MQRIAAQRYFSSKNIALFHNTQPIFRHDKARMSAIEAVKAQPVKGVLKAAFSFVRNTLKVVVALFNRQFHVRNVVVSRR